MRREVVQQRRGDPRAGHAERVAEGDAAVTAIDDQITKLQQIGEKTSLEESLQLDPLRQSIGAQCSGTLLLARLGLLADMPACTSSRGVQLSTK